MHRSSPQRIAAFERRRDAMDCPPLALTLDVRTRWNSTYDMLNRAVKLKEAYVAMTAPGSELEEFALSASDWTKIQGIIEVLKPFEDATQTLSSSKSHASVNMTILCYNRIMDALEKLEERMIATDPELCHAIRCGLDKLVRYYSRTDMTEVYAVATALDPRLKFRWWRRHGWEKEWCKFSEDLVREAWRKFSGVVAMDEEVTERAQQLHELFLTELTKDELSEYVDQPTIAPLVAPRKSDELVFWEVNQAHWPNLATMAAQYLAVPATSTPSERCFSSTRLLLPHVRNRLSPGMIKQLMLLGSWFDLNIHS